MKQKNLRFRLLILCSALGLLAVSCGQPDTDEDPDPSTHNRAGLDESISCPEGEVGWRFPARELNRNTEEYDSRAGEDAEIDLQPRRAIDIVSATCDGSDADEIGELRSACSGQQSCEYMPSCSASYTFTYVCGQGDVDSSGDQIEYSVSNSDADASGKLTIECEQPEDAPAPAEARTACVPEQCHGRARRNEDMECVADSTKLETAVGAYIDEGPTPLYKTQTDHNLDTLFTGGKSPHPYLYPNMPYEFSMTFFFENNLVPQVSTFAVWVEDSYKKRGDADEVVHAYRCTPFKVDVNRDDPHTMVQDDIGGRNRARYEKTVTKTLSRDCFNVDFPDGRPSHKNLVSLKNGARRAGVSLVDFQREYVFHESKLRISYDMEGRAVWHKDGVSKTPEELAESAPECVPNPTSFFYDSESDSYDLRAYYAQRALSYAQRVKFVDNGFPRRVEIGTQDIKARRELTIRTHASYNPSLPIDVSWYAVNYDEGNPFNPFPKDKTVAKGWTSGEDSDNWGPKNLRAEIYIYPKEDYYVRRGDEVFNKLGELPLKDPVPEGKTDTVKIAITNRVKELFTDPNSPAYMSGDTQAYELFYCIMSDPPTPRTRPEQWRYALSAKGNNGMPANFAADEAYWGLLGEPDEPNPSVYLESQEQTDARPYEYPRGRLFGWSWRGCRRSKVPLIVHLDRFHTPTEPVSPQSFNGSAAQTTTGDDKMSGGNDNDSQVTCHDAAKTDCDQAQDGQNRTEGEGGRSTYDITTSTRHAKGDSVSADLKGEMLGMQLVDPSDAISSSADWPQDGDVSPVNVTIEPDWDGLRSSLESASQGNSVGVEWTTGRYGGAMGLGVGWGYKFRWQLGPIPVLVTFSATVGFSTKFQANFYFAPESGDAYPCVGESSTCVTVVDTPASFADAVQDCAVRGGRLAELSSRTEAQQTLAARPDSDIWIGGQLAYRHPKPQCETSFNADLCTADSKTQFRWLSNSAAFASNTGQDQPTIDDSQLLGSPTTSLNTNYPTESAVYLSSGATLKTASVTEQKPYMCVFEPAAKEDFFKWDTSLTLGAAAGFGLEGCSPNDDVGFCLGATFNVVALTIAPTYSNVYHWLYREGESEPFGRRGNAQISVPWSLNIFQGALTATAKLWWLSANWIIAAYDGITVDSGKLLDVNMPVKEDF